MVDVNINFTAPPTVARFMSSEAFGRLIAGPVGSGKTTGCIYELLRRACQQEPAPDGYRYTRFAIVRQSLKQLKDTVLKDVMSALQGITQYKVSESTIHLQFGDVRSEWMMIPLDNMDDQRRLLSMQLTGAWLSESIEMDLSLIDPLAGRCGRFPGPKLGGCTWRGLIADTNMPEDGSDWHTFMEDPPLEWQVFIQPGGLTPQAENLQWLNQTSETLKLPEDDPVRIAEGRKYYLRLLDNAMGQNWVKRYVHAVYGDDPSGTAVFADSFNRAFHVAEDGLMPVPGHPLLIGQDFGRDPWSIICQVDHMGRLLVLEEVPAENIGLDMHLRDNLKPRLITERYLGKSIAVVGDPAGKAKSSLYEETNFDLLKRHGFSAYPAPTNDIDPRLRAVESFLLQQRNGGAAFLIDAGRCPKLTRALAGGYKFEKMRDGRRKVTPKKDEYSHPADALQYAALAALGGQWEAITRRLYSIANAQPQRRMSAKAWT